MKEKIIITNVLCYEKEGISNTRITYLLVGKDRLANNSKFKGFTEITSFIKGDKCFNSITLEMIGKPLDALFESKPDYQNPLNVRNFLTSIDYNGSTIDLL